MQVLKILILTFVSGILASNILSKREVKEGRSFSHLNGKEVAFDGSEWLLRG